MLMVVGATGSGLHWFLALVAVGSSFLLVFGVLGVRSSWVLFVGDLFMLEAFAFRGSGFLGLVGLGIGGSW